MAGSFPAPTFADASGRSAIPATATAAINARIDKVAPGSPGTFPARVASGVPLGVGELRRDFAWDAFANRCGFEKMDYGARNPLPRA